MKIIALLKQTPATDTKIKLQDGGTGINLEGANMIMNPYDEFAVEEAIKIKEAQGGGEVVLVSLGPDKATESIRTGLAMGGDRAIHINDAALNGSDSLAIAKALAKAIEAEGGFDLILCGKSAVDTDGAAVGLELASLLNIPALTYTIKLEVADGKAKINREAEGGTEVVQAALPALVTCQKGLNEPRFPTLPNIMKAKKKEIKALDLAGIGLSAGEVGAGGSKTKVASLELPPAKQAGKPLQGEAAETAKKLIDQLHNEAKLI